MWEAVTMKKLDCLSDWQLDQLYYLGDKWEGRQQALLHMETCESCCERYQARVLDAEVLQQQAGFQALLQQGVQRFDAPVPSQPSFWNAWLSLTRLSWVSAMAVVLVVVILSPWDWGPSQIGKSLHPTIRMLHFRKGSQYSQWTQDGERLRPGALIQFTYLIPTSLHMMVVSLNQQGQVSVFFPLGKTESTLRQAGSGTLPPNQSLELDDSIGQERIFVIASSRPFSLSDVQQALLQAFKERAGRLAYVTKLSRNWKVYSILIHKQKEATPPIP